MLWSMELCENERLDLQQKGVLQLGHYMKKYGRGRSGQWLKLSHTRIFLDEKKQCELFLMGSPDDSDAEGVFYCKSIENKFLLNGRPTKGSFVFSGDRLVIDQHIFDFTSEKKDPYEVYLSQSCIFSDDIVLIEGETGTGKGFLAHKIMQQRNPLRPWVHINLAALAPSLLESEIFGHVKGAFTGACYENRWLS